MIDPFPMDERVREFLERHHSAAMTTLRPDGSPHVARIGVALVDGKLWSSGTQARVRTSHVRSDPRSAVFVFDTDPGKSWRWLGLETAASIIEGPGAPEASLRLFRVMQEGMAPAPAQGNVLWEGNEKRPDEFLEIMAEEQRLIYEFEIVRDYGLY